MKQNNHLISVVIASILTVLLIVIWKSVYSKKENKESGYLYLDGSWYVNKPWMDSWPNH